MSNPHLPSDYVFNLVHSRHVHYLPPEVSRGPPCSISRPNPSPHSLVKTRLQGGAASAQSAVRTLANIAQTEGIPGLYRGVSSKLLQTVLASAILFAGQKRFYEITKKVCTHQLNILHRLPLMLLQGLDLRSSEALAYPSSRI